MKIGEEYKAPGRRGHGGRRHAFVGGSDWAMMTSAFSIVRQEIDQGAFRLRGTVRSFCRTPRVDRGQGWSFDYLDERNKDPTLFVWTADADLILGKVRRFSERFSDSGHSSLNKETA